jgi:trehalose 2-sulfotransferase
VSYARWVLRPTLPEHATEPRTSYLVCGTPRSGTWLLCGLLASTGIAGRPHEYFDTRTEQAAKQAWGTATFAEYLTAVLAAGTTDNGVFGAKVMWASLSNLVARLREDSLRPGAHDRAVMEAAFPELLFVWVRREDMVAQAVSWSKAIQTGHWHHWDPPGSARPRFHFDEIDALMREIEEHDAAWRDWFERNEIHPLELRFEELVGEKQAVVHRVVAALGIDAASVPVAEQTAKVGNSVNDEWTRRYRALKSL